MGLSSKEPLAMVKEEINNDGCEEIGSDALLLFWDYVAAA